MEKNKPKVLIIYTGGTIGMVQDVKTGSLKAFDFKHLTAQVPELERLNADLSTISFEKPIDSSEINLKHWGEIANTIFENYVNYDGFVVLHGSDTMAYTASALSFMLQGLKKPVILTGSQLPIGTIRTDGKENLITAIEIAAEKDVNGNSVIQEVAIYFEYSLYRGNRTTKVSASHFEAFLSPNYPELAIAGVNINYQTKKDFDKQSDLTCFVDFESKIALIKIYPGFLPEIYTSLFENSKVKGIVLESYGAGNIPSNSSFQEMISTFIKNGGIILNITQCYKGKVNQGKYETSYFLENIGVIGGGDLTTEAAVAKMMYLFGKYEDKTIIIKELSKNLCGEVSLD